MNLFQIPRSPVPRLIGKRAHAWRDYEWSLMGPFAVVHLLALGGLFVDVSWADWMCCAVLYVVRMFGVTAGYHRYFSHRAFKTSRLAQFLLACLAQTSAQRGVLWWAGEHRHHHRHSDTERDVHSPGRWGFWHAHIAWIYDGTRQTNYDKMRDFAIYPELLVLNKLWYGPPILLGIAVFVLLGWSGLFVGFMLSTVLVCHATFAINSLSHLWGTRRFATDDTSRNHWLPALLLFGEGWHNNHHHYMSSARSGFFWWEVDLTYCGLVVLRRLGLVWGLREVPAHVYETARTGQPPAP